MEATISIQRLWSMVSTLVIMLVIGLIFSPASNLLLEFGSFMTGGVDSIIKNDQGFLDYLPSLLFLAVIDLLLSIITIAILWGIFNVRPGKGVHDSINAFYQPEKNYFSDVVVTVALEELFARWLFLGVLPRVFPWVGSVGFYIFLFLGNGLWSLAHLRNYKDKADRRQWYRVLPQFLGGFIHAYIFVKYGLVAAIVSHMAFDSILFAGSKVQICEWKQIVADIFAVVVTIGLAMMISSKTLLDVLPWFNGMYDRSQLSDWTVVDYICIVISAYFGLSLFFDLLLYDSSVVVDDAESKHTIMALIVGPPIAVGLIFVVNALLSTVIDELLIRALVITVLLNLLGKNPSISGAVRRFWSGLATTYILIVCIVTVNFWIGVVVVGVHSIYLQAVNSLIEEVIE